MSNKKDWPPLEVKYALAKKGKSMADISRMAGAAARTSNNVFRRPYPRFEKLISDVLGVPPEEIWPSRYPSKTDNKLSHVRHWGNA